MTKAKKQKSPQRPATPKVQPKVEPNARVTTASAESPLPDPGAPGFKAGKDI